jgi:DNA mismatch endonuclease (patch repair protein)
MSRIKSENTLPEKLLFSELRKEKIRFSKHYKIPGRPDVVFPKYKVAVFVDGEFWHGKNFNDWKKSLTPFWYKKISDNISRDKKVRKELKMSGWRIIRLWGREVVKRTDRSVLKITKLIEKTRNKN